jgi:glutamyl-tRNA synthetase
VAEAFHERAETLLEMAASARYCYEDFETFEPKSAKKHLRPVILEPLKTVRARLAGLKHWGKTAISEAIQGVADDYEISMGKLGQPIRVAVTGGPVSPPLDETLWLVGQDRTIERLDKALAFIAERAGQAA